MLCSPAMLVSMVRYGHVLCIAAVQLPDELEAYVQEKSGWPDTCPTLRCCAFCAVVQLRLQLPEMEVYGPGEHLKGADNGCMERALGEFVSRWLRVDEQCGSGWLGVKGHL